MTVGERQLRITGVLENVWVACEFVVTQARELGMEERAIHHCYLAVDEACTNIIEHGYSSSCETCIIDITCQSDAQQFKITIADDSPPFNPLLRPDPDVQAPLSERGAGGWGIYFIKKLMDSVTYTYEGGRNHLVMVKKLSRNLRRKTDEFPAVQAVKVQVLPNNVWLLVPEGRLDTAQSPGFAAAFSRQLEQGRRAFIVDMALVDYVSSAGLKTLVSSWQRVRDLKGDMVLASLTPRVREILQMTGLDLVFTFAENVQDAERRFTPKNPRS